MSIHEIELSEDEIRANARVIGPGKAVIMAKVPPGAKFVMLEKRNFGKTTVLVFEAPDEPATGLEAAP